MVEPLKIPSVSLRPSEVQAKELRTPRLQDAVTPTRSFKDILAEAVTEVQQLQTDADNTIRQLVAGEIKDVSEAMVAIEKADVAFQTMMTVRNKVMDAYQEIIRTQV